MLNFLKYFEAFLVSGRQPLYHFTNSYYFNKILKDDILKVGFYNNIVNGEHIKIISLTRNMNFKSETHHRDLDVRITLNAYKLKQKYKILPYDFAINQKTDIYTKSNIKRTKIIEFEEVIKTDISNVGIYITDIDFNDEDAYYLYRDGILKYNMKYPKINFTINGRKEL